MTIKCMHVCTVADWMLSSIQLFIKVSSCTSHKLWSTKLAVIMFGMWSTFASSLLRRWHHLASSQPKQFSATILASLIWWLYCEVVGSSTCIRSSWCFLFYFTWYNWLTSLLTFFTATLLPPLPLPSLFTIVLLVEVSLLFLTCTSLSLNSASYSSLSSSSIANTLLLTSNSVDLQSKLSIYTTDSFAGLLLNILSSESKNTNFEIRYCSPCCLV